MDARRAAQARRQAQTDNGSAATVANVASRAGEADRRNLTVQDVHTYYVMAAGTPVLMHNVNLCEIDAVWHPGTYNTAQSSFAGHFAGHGGSMTDQEYLDSAVSFAERVTSPGGSAGMTVKGNVDIGYYGDGVGRKYTDSTGQMILIAG